MAKRFFYVCAGLLCLAVVYHLGARSVTAQGALIEAGDVESYLHTAVQGRVVYVASGGQWPGLGEHRALPPVPGTSRVVAVNSPTPGRAVAILENADVWHYDDNLGGWIFAGSMFGGAITVEPTSFGSVKARYLGEREPKGVKPSTNR